MSKNKSTTVKKYSKLLEKDEDWDFAYLLELEQFKLKRMFKYFKKSNLVSDNDIILRDLSLCIKLIDIILERDIKGYLYDDTKKLPYINTKNAEKFIRKFLKYDNPTSKYVLDHLRQTKALHLYNLIRSYRMHSWWD